MKVRSQPFDTSATSTLPSPPSNSLPPSGSAMPPSSPNHHLHNYPSRPIHVDPTKTLPALPSSASSNQGKRNRDSIGLYLASKTAKAHIPSAAPVTTILGSGFFKPLWQHTMITPEEIASLELSAQEIKRQETIFELIFTEKEYIEDLKSIQRIFVDDLKARYAECKKKKRFGTDKQDIVLEEKLDRLLTHIHALWNGHQSLLNFLQQRQTKAKPVVEQIGDIFVNNFYMFPIYDSYFTQYGSVSKEFEYLRTGTSDLVVLIRELLLLPQCKLLTLEGIFLKPIQRLQKYQLFFKDLLALTPESNPDHEAIQEALEKHKQGLSKIDDQKWIQEHNEMLRDLQQRIKGLPTGFSLVDQYRYLVLDGPVYRVKSPQFKDSKSRPKSCYLDPLYDGRAPFLIQQQPSLLKYHHQHRLPQTTPPSSHSPAGSSSSTSSESRQLGNGSGSNIKSNPLSIASSSSSTPSSSPSTPWYISFARLAFGGGRSSKSSSTSSSPSLSSSAPSIMPSPTGTTPTRSDADVSTFSDPFPDIDEVVLSSLSHQPNHHWNRFLDHRSPLSARHPAIPASIRNPDADAEYYVFVFTDIVLWTKRVTSRYQRKDGALWTFKLVEPVSRLTQVDSTEDDYIFHCTSVNNNSNSYFVRTEDEVAAKMWKSTIPSLVNFHCSRHQLDYGRKR